MSLSLLMEQGHALDLEVLHQVLGRHLQRWASAPTEEERLIIEGETIQELERLLDLDISPELVGPGQLPDTDSVLLSHGEDALVYRSLEARFIRLAEQFSRYHDIRQLALEELVGRLARVKQKQAVLALRRGTEARYLSLDSFLTRDGTTDRGLSTDALEVHTKEGMVTLPVSSRQTLAVDQIVIGSGSNGSLGNSDRQVIVHNLSPMNTVDEDPDTWFEYERLDAGPLVLVLRIELKRPQVVNHLSIEPVNTGQTSSFVVSDVTLGDDVSIHELLPMVDDDFFEVSPSEGWSASFVPVQTRTVTVRLTQEGYQPVETVSGTRRRYAIGISNLLVQAIRYESVGSLRSVAIPLPSGLYAAEPVIVSHPEVGHTLNLKASINEGERWEELEAAESLVLDGTTPSVTWEISVDRDAQVGSLLARPATRRLRSLLRTVDRGRSPTSIPLPSSPYKGRALAIEPRVARRGRRATRLEIARGTGAAMSVSLPFTVLSEQLSPGSLHVYVDGVEQTYEEDDSALSTGGWSLSDDFDELLLPSSVGTSSVVELVIDPEQMLLEKKSDGYYHRCELLFDPDPDNIKLVGLVRSPRRINIVLPRDRTRIPLGHENIDSSSFKLISEAGTALTEVTTRAAVLSTPDSYMVNYRRGVVWLNAAIDGDTIKASFEHHPYEEVTDFSVVSEGPVPVGVKIAPGALRTTEHTDTVGDTPARRLDVVVGEYGARSVPLTPGTNAQPLTHDYVIKGTVRVSADLVGSDEPPEEVDFIDGRSEFFGLTSMTEEQTVETEADSSGLIEFTLAAGALVYADLGVDFGDSTVFSSEKSSVSGVSATGHYHIASDGTVTVHVGSGGTLSGGISISYYYRDPDFDPSNKFSVDYRRGGLYSYADLGTGETITYKASRHLLSYDVARALPLPSWRESDRSVQVHAESLSKRGFTVKVLWEEELGGRATVDLTGYFSPLFYRVGFRFY